MKESNGTVRKEIPIVKFESGEVHLQNEILSKKCYICHKDKADDMAILRIEDKKMSFVCLDHPGVVQEFLKQYKHLPLGWSREK